MGKRLQLVLWNVPNTCVPVGPSGNGALLREKRPDPSLGVSGLSAEARLTPTKAVPLITQHVLAGFV